MGSGVIWKMLVSPAESPGDSVNSSVIPIDEALPGPAGPPGKFADAVAVHPAKIEHVTVVGSGNRVRAVAPLIVPVKIPIPLTVAAVTEPSLLLSVTVMPTDEPAIWL